MTQGTSGIAKIFHHLTPSLTGIQHTFLISSLSVSIRKLSVTVSLSDEEEYKGGELEFDFRNLDPDKKRNIYKCKEILPKGSLVVFPSFVWHRVCPVKKGSRYSLVIWNLGRPFR